MGQPLFLSDNNVGNTMDVGLQNDLEDSQSELPINSNLFDESFEGFWKA